MFFIATLILCILGGVIIFRATTWGPWAFSDSASYISAAKNFSIGNGFVIVNSNGSQTRVTEFPPFYPIFLSLFLGSEGNPFVLLRFVNIALFVAFIILLGCFLYYSTRNTIISTLGILICLSAPIIVETFSGVMSETLFLPLLLSILLLAYIYIQKKETHIFILLVVLSALLPITRYAGSLFVAVTAILIFALSNDKFMVRFKQAALYVAIAMLPLGLWFGKLYIQLNKVGGKSFNFGFDLFKSLLSSILAELDVVKRWLPYYGIYDNPIIDKFLSIGGLIVFFTLIALFILNLQKKENKSNRNLFVFSIISLIGYILFIAFTHSITIPQIDIIDRMMVPLYPLFAGMIISGLAFLFTNNQRLLSIFAIGALLIILRFNFLSSFVYIDEMQENGHGFSAREFQEAGILEELKSLPEDQRLISNSSAFVLYHINRFPLQINQFANMPFGDHNGYGEKTFRDREAALIIIYPHFRNYYGDSADQLLENITDGLIVAYQDDVSGIYYYSSEEATQP